MKLSKTLDYNKPVKVWLLVLLSLIPFVCCYSFVRIKKFRKMFLVNLGIIILFMIYLIMHYNLADQPDKILQDIKWLNYIILPGIDAILVFIWSRRYNQRLEEI